MKCSVDTVVVVVVEDREKKTVVEVGYLLTEANLVSKENNSPTTTRNTTRMFVEH